MKKCKVLKEMPGMPVGTLLHQSDEDPKTYRLGDIITKNKYKLSVDYVNSFPEFFEEIEYLTTTEDGVDVKEFDFVSWCIRNDENTEWAYKYDLEVVDLHLVACLKDKDVYRIFSTKEAAEIFCENENEKIFFEGLPLPVKNINYHIKFHTEDKMIMFSIAHVYLDIVIFDYIGMKKFSDVAEKLSIMKKIDDYYKNK